MSKNPYNATPTQIATLDAGVVIARRIYRELLTQARALADSLVPAGTVNEDGTLVCHGANNMVHAQINNLFTASEFLKTTIDNDYADLVRYEVRCIGGGRFISETEMAEHYGHCLRMIPGLRARFGEDAA